MYFRLKLGVGSHAEPQADGTTRIYNAKDQEVIRAGTDLAARFPLKFDRVAEPIIAPTPAADIAGPLVADESIIQASMLGDDVTQRYPMAIQERFKVFRTCRPDADDDDYFITEEDNINVPLNDAPLPRSKVKSALKKLAKK